jgi:hypothetical protein
MITINIKNKILRGTQIMKVHTREIKNSERHIYEGTIPDFQPPLVL